MDCLYFILTPRCFPEPNRIDRDKAGRAPFLLLTSSNTIITKNKNHGTFQNYREDVKALRWNGYRTRHEHPVCCILSKRSVKRQRTRQNQHSLLQPLWCRPKEDECFKPCVFKCRKTVNYKLWIQLH